MAGNREIEFKAIRVNPQQFKDALFVLNELARLGHAQDMGAVNQEDFYLDHPAFKDTDYALYSKGAISKSLRIRRENSLSGSEQNHSLCVKVARKGSVESDHERREYELQIKDPALATKVFELLGFSVEKKLNKIRTSFRYLQYEIVLDQVVGLKKSATSDFYEEEFFSYIVEVELKEGADQVSDIPACIEAMKELVETVLKIKDYQQDQSGMEKYMK
ncbi:MAG: hypothetical protein HW387_1086 [Parachlamydiales bacterium]|nr:hypothetical protein [Parachlamydiales bacterium]